MSGLKRRAAPGNMAAVAVDGVIPFPDAKFADKRPLLAEFFTRVFWGPGEPREKGSLFLFVEDGMFKCCVNDKDSSQVAFVTGTTLDGLLDAVEKGLAQDRLDWRLSSQGKARRGK